MEDNKTSKALVRFVVIMLILALIAVGILLFVRNRKKNVDFSSAVVDKEVEMSLAGSSKCIPYDENGDSSGFLQYDSDGITAYNSNGDSLWNFAYSISNPSISTCGKFTVVAETNGRNFYIIDGKGNVKDYTIDGEIYTILKADVSANGVAAILTASDIENHIFVYTTEKTEYIVDIYTTVKNNGIPVTIAISDDGKKLATSYITIKDGKANTWLTFYNFGSVGGNKEDNIVGAFGYEDTMIPRMTFTSADSFTAFSSKGIELFTIPEIPKVLKTDGRATNTPTISPTPDPEGVNKNLEHTTAVTETKEYQLDDTYNEIYGADKASSDETKTIKDTFYNDIYSCLIVVGKDNKLSVEIYSNETGKFQGKFELEEYKGISLVNDKVVVYRDDSFKVYNFKGKLEFETDKLNDKEIEGLEYVFSNGKKENGLLLLCVNKLIKVSFE